MAHYKHYFVKYSLQDSRDKKFRQRAQKSLCLASVEEDEEVEDAQNGGRAARALLASSSWCACASCNFVPTANRAVIGRCGRRVAWQKTTQSRFGYCCQVRFETVNNRARFGAGWSCSVLRWFESVSVF